MISAYEALVFAYDIDGFSHYVTQISLINEYEY